MKLIWLAAVLLLVVVEHKGVAAIQCFVCNSDTASNCLDPYDKPAVDKTGGCTYCTKLAAKSSGQNVVIRGCLNGTAPFNGCQQESYADYTGNTCACGDELCNGAGPVALNFASSLSILFAHWIFRD